VQTCGNTSLSLRFSSDFLVSTKGKVMFAAASFRNSSAQFFLSLRGVLTLVSCPIVLSSFSSNSHCLKQFCESVFSPLMLFSRLIILKLWLICRKCSQKWILGSLWKEKHFLQPKCRKHFRQTIENWGSSSTN